MKRFFQLCVVAVTLALVALYLTGETDFEWQEHAAIQAKGFQRPSKGSLGSASMLPAARDRVRDESFIDPEQVALEKANEYLKSHREEWHIQSFHELRSEMETSPLGHSVRYDVYQDGIPVLASAILVQIDLRGNASATIDYQAIEKIDLANAKMMPFEEALNNLSDKFGEDPAVPATPRKVILINRTTQQAPFGELAYLVSVIDKTHGTPLELVLRASDGQVLKKVFGRSEIRR